MAHTNSFLSSLCNVSARYTPENKVKNKKTCETLTSGQIWRRRIPALRYAWLVSQITKAVRCIRWLWWFMLLLLRLPKGICQNILRNDKKKQNLPAYPCTATVVDTSPVIGIPTRPADSSPPTALISVARHQIVSVRGGQIKNNFIQIRQKDRDVCVCESNLLSGHITVDRRRIWRLIILWWTSGCRRCFVDNPFFSTLTTFGKQFSSCVYEFFKMYSVIIYASLNLDCACFWMSFF